MVMLRLVFKGGVLPLPRDNPYNGLQLSTSFHTALLVGIDPAVLH